MDYLDRDEFLAELKKSKRLPKATDKLGIMLMTLVDHILRSNSFCRYNESLKEDMRGFALMKMVRGIELFDESKDAKAVFSYFTHACFNAFFTILSKHYKQQNIKRALMKKLLMGDGLSNTPGKQAMLEEIE